MWNLWHLPKRGLLRILCGYTNLCRKTEVALASYNVEYEDTSADDFAYWRAIESRWGTDDLIAIEQDIVVHAMVIAEFAECEQPWCSFPYSIGFRKPYEYGLGCTRFRKGMMQEIATGEILDSIPCDGQPGCWQTLDIKIRYALWNQGYNVHVHQPTVNHLVNEKGEKGCLSLPELTLK